MNMTGCSAACGNGLSEIDQDMEKRACMVTNDTRLSTLISCFAMALHHHITTIGNDEYFTLNVGGQAIDVRLKDGSAGMVDLIDVAVLSRIKARFHDWKSMATLVMEECLNSANGTELSEFGQTFWKNLVKDMGVAVDKNSWLLNAYP